MSSPIKIKQSKVWAWGQAYLNWLSQNNWRCVIGLYYTGVIGAFALWGFCKLIVVLLVWVL